MSMSVATVLPAGPESQVDLAISSRQAWYVVALLTMLYALSYTDRLLLALMAQPVGSALKLTDGQLGLLLGAGFAVVYAISSVPIADRIDRGNRVTILVAGVTVWSVTTIASAFATDFWTLLGMRGGVALGEAVLTPAAVSLIGDLFVRENRTLPTAIYGSMASVMSTGALLVGGAVLGFAGTLEHSTGLAAWQLTFVLLGLPGLVLAVLIVMTVRDPRPARTASAGLVNFVEMARYLGRNARFYGPFYLGLALITVVSMGTISWIPTMLVRRFGHSAAEAGYYLGGIGIAAGIVSAIFWPWLSHRLARAGRTDGTLICLLASGLLATVTLAVGVRSASANVVLAMFFIAQVGLASVGVLGPLTIQQFSPGVVRARLTSLYILATALLGYAVGPITVVALSRFWSGPAALANGLSLNGAIAGTLSSITFFFCMRASRRMKVENG